MHADATPQAKWLDAMQLKQATDSDCCKRVGSSSSGGGSGGDGTGASSWSGEYELEHEHRRTIAYGRDPHHSGRVVLSQQSAFVRTKNRSTSTIHANPYPIPHPHLMEAWKQESG